MNKGREIPHHEIEQTGDYKVTYKTFSITTNQTFKTTRTFLSRRHFLEALNKWNRQGGGQWLYTEVKDYEMENDRGN